MVASQKHLFPRLFQGAFKKVSDRDGWFALKRLGVVKRGMKQSPLDC